jgi:hypothetical protein
MRRHTLVAATALLGALTVELLASTNSVAAVAHKPVPPKIVSASVKCVVTSHENLPGLPNVPLYSPKVSWKVTHATGMALSVDDPNLVGSYGTFGKSGSVILGGGCYKGDGKTTLTFNTVGGHGKRAHKTIVFHGKKTVPTPPPFGSPS